MVFIAAAFVAFIVAAHTVQRYGAILPCQSALLTPTSPAIVAVNTAYVAFLAAMSLFLAAVFIILGVALLVRFVPLPSETEAPLRFSAKNNPPQPLFTLVRTLNIQLDALCTPNQFLVSVLIPILGSWFGAVKLCCVEPPSFFFKSSSC